MANFLDLFRSPVRAAPAAAKATELIPAMVNMVFGATGGPESYTGTPGILPHKGAGTGIYHVSYPTAKAVYLAGNPVYYDAAGGANHSVCPKSKSTTEIVLTHCISQTGTHAAADGTASDSMDVALWVEL